MIQCVQIEALSVGEFAGVCQNVCQSSTGE